MCYERRGFSRLYRQISTNYTCTNTLNAELNPICHLLALLGIQHILHIIRIRVKISLSVKHTIAMNWRSSYRQFVTKQSWRNAFPEIQSISLKLNKINCLNLSLGSTEHQLASYSFAQFNIIEYDIGARGTSNFIQLNENASLFVQYHVHLGDTKENI
jgi:hypothetical protein